MPDDHGTLAPRIIRKVVSRMTSHLQPGYWPGPLSACAFGRSWPSLFFFFWLCEAGNGALLEAFRAGALGCSFLSCEGGLSSGGPHFGLGGTLVLNLYRGFAATLVERAGVVIAGLDLNCLVPAPGLDHCLAVTGPLLGLDDDISASAVLHRGLHVATAARGLNSLVWDTLR